MSSKSSCTQKNDSIFHSHKEILDEFTLSVKNNNLNAKEKLQRTSSNYNRFLSETPQIKRISAIKAASISILIEMCFMLLVMYVKGDMTFSFEQYMISLFTTSMLSGFAGGVLYMNFVFKKTLDFFPSGAMSDINCLLEDGDYNSFIQTVDNNMVNGESINHIKSYKEMLDKNESSLTKIELHVFKKMITDIFN